jgi:hypothetical protein
VRIGKAYAAGVAGSCNIAQVGQDLDDTNVGNRYAFDTFERVHDIPRGPKEERQEFPWIDLPESVESKTSP